MAAEHPAATTAPRPYFEDDSVKLYLGDALEILPLLPAVDVVVTDPPYGETSLAWDVRVNGWLRLLRSDSLWCFGSLRSFMATGREGRAVRRGCSAAAVADGAGRVTQEARSAATKRRKRKPRRAAELGITASDYDALLTAQDGVCAICGNPPKTRRLHVDHNHRTGKVRGLLCFRCNRGLPTYATSDWLEAAREYVLRDENGDVPDQWADVPDQWEAARNP